MGDFGFAVAIGGGVKFAEVPADGVGFEVEAVDGVLVAAAFDGGPFDDVGGGGAEGIAHVGLLVDLFGAGAGETIGEELVGGEVCAFGAVDDIEEAVFNGVGHSDAEVEVPGIRGIFDFRI